MSGIGERLKQEREKLGLSQAKLAEACGVGKTAQYTYEIGERSPDARYLRAAAKVGVDVAYVVYGGRSTLENTLRGLVVEDLFFLLCTGLGFDDGEIHTLEDKALKIAKDMYEKQDDAGGAAPYLVDMVSDFISRAFEGEGHGTRLLADTIEQFESVLLQKNISLQPGKKAVAIVMLYRSFRASGKIDPKAVEDAIALAV